jgi:hypothetical protein
MKRHTHTDLLHRLQAQLRHFDHSPDFGDAAAVAAIRSHLLVRIREAEGLVRSHSKVRVEQMSRVEAA